MSDCLFPQPFFDAKPYPFGTGRVGLCEGLGLRPEFDVVYPIDAPESLPSGGVRAVGYSGGRNWSSSFASAAVFRS